MGTIENGRNKILDVNVLQKNKVKVLGDTPAKETVENYIPMMTWEDWHLLQELHKARAGQSQNIEPSPAKVEVVRETINSEVRHRYDNVVIPVNGSTTDRLANEVRNAELTVAELQEKCQELEQQLSDAKAAAVTAIDLKDKYLAENRQLSKSLQHYRNAYFADSVTQPGSVTGAAGIHFGGAGQGGAK